MRAFTYLRLQLKRFSTSLPRVILISFMFLLCAVAVFYSVMGREEEKKERFQIGIVGDTSDTYLGLGIVALKNLDSSRFGIDVNFMSEDEARRGLISGELSAYIIIPDGFIRDAYHGDVGKLTYVSTPGAVDVGTLIKDELLRVISIMLVESQKGIYAAGNVAEELVDGMKYRDVSDDIALSYVDLILSRSKMYELDVLGVSQGLDMMTSVFCGAVIVFLLLMGIGFAPVFSRGDVSFCGVLAARRFGAVYQVIYEYLAFTLCSACAVALFALPFLLLEAITVRFFTAILLSLVMITAMQMLIFELSGGVSVGVLLQFLVAIALSYFTGCLYPIYFFPEAIQRISSFLPTGAVRLFLSQDLGGEGSPLSLCLILIYFLVFLVSTVMIRRVKILKMAGEAL